MVQNIALADVLGGNNHIGHDLSKLLKGVCCEKKHLQNLGTSIILISKPVIEVFDDFVLEGDQAFLMFPPVLSGVIGRRYGGDI